MRKINLLLKITAVFIFVINMVHAQNDYIITGDSESIEAKISELNLKGKALSKEIGIYQIKGQSKSSLKKLFPNSVIEKNNIIERQPQVINDPIKIRINKSSKKYNVNTIKNNSKDNKDNTESKWNKCTNNGWKVKPEDEAPKALLSRKNYISDLARYNSVYYGNTIRFSLNNSRPHENHNSPLRYAWKITPPTYSKTEAKWNFKDSIDYKLDTTGKYRVQYCTQDQRNVCACGTYYFGATANATWRGPKKIPQVADNFLSYFSWLDRINAQAAWKKSKGEGVVFAVIDTGINTLSPYLSANIYENPGEIPGNGKDDDQNGYTDDIIGWDFHHNDASPFDDEGHGTHVSGIIASPLFGVAPKAKILPIKAFGPAEGNKNSNMIMAFIYAVNMGVDIINFSAGGQSHRGKAYQAVLEYARSRGIIVITSAGNNSKDVDVTAYYPSVLMTDNMMSIAALKKDGTLSEFSNWGKNTIHLAAPGGNSTKEDNILSVAQWNIKGEIWARKSGTSQAAPIVSGVMALIKALDKDNVYPPKYLINHLEDTSTPLEGLDNKLMTPGSVNAEEAVKRFAL